MPGYSNSTDAICKARLRHLFGGPFFRNCIIYDEVGQVNDNKKCMFIKLRACLEFREHNDKRNYSSNKINSVDSQRDIS